MRIPVKLRRQVRVTQFCTALSSGFVAKMKEAKDAVQEKVNSIFRVNFQNAKNKDCLANEQISAMSQVTVRGVSNVLVLYTGGTIGMIRCKGKWH